MLKHVIMNHPEEDMADVKFGMKVLKFCQTSFERQALEAVTIQKERKTHHLLNSRTEYNRSSGKTSIRGPFGTRIPNIDFWKWTSISKYTI